VRRISGADVRARGLSGSCTCAFEGDSAAGAPKPAGATSPVRVHPIQSPGPRLKVDAIPPSKGVEAETMSSGGCEICGGVLEESREYMAAGADGRLAAVPSLRCCGCGRVCREPAAAAPCRDSRAESRPSALLVERLVELLSTPRLNTRVLN
jgi:hypothetical protein